MKKNFFSLRYRLSNFFFTDFSENFKIFAIDAVKLVGQKNITKLLMALDRGNYIRQLDNYQKILTHFDFHIAKNRYLRFPYDHLISTKNIDKKGRMVSY